MPRNEIYFPQINSLILESVRNLLNKSTTVDFWETLSKEQKDEILQGIKEIENGEVVDYEEFVSKHR
jgi:predicted transcriptional regulator